jgi:hypothetical protein
MVINPTKINTTNNHLYHCCLEVFVLSVDLGGIDDHCCLEVIVRFVDLGGIDYHYCVEVIVCFSKQQCSSIPPRSTDQTITSKQQC